jgi:hypothetical protein
MMEVKQVGSYSGKPGLPARCEQAHAAGTGSFTPERQETTVVGAVWINFTGSLDEAIS